MIDYNEVHMALRSRLEAVAELPLARAWEQVEFTPSALAPHVEEDFVPATSRLISGPAAHGTIQTDGLYVVRVYGLTNQGDAPIRDVVAAILAAFAHMRSQTLTSGDRLYIRSGLSEPGPVPSQILPAGKNKSRCAVTIPWRVHSVNSIPSS